MSRFFWNPNSCEAELNSALHLVSLYHGEWLAEKDGESELLFRRGAGNGVKVAQRNGKWSVEASSVSGFLRGVSHVFAGVETEETTPFETLGAMFDCSRNKVFRLDWMKRTLVKLALMGYSMAMLYTEDTYLLPGEPFFGYMRGAYRMEELKELDAFAKTLGIELIGCIETLGHLEQILAYGEYAKVRDTASVLMVDAPETYLLIEKMILFWKEALSSRRIHIGMDETHDLGRGRYLDRNGFHTGFELFSRHLGRVNQLCSENGMNPIIWSDMYFRLGNKEMNYYDLNTEIPQEVRAGIPRNVKLCYWDYYSKDADFYEKFIGLHRDLGFEPVMGSGVWTWRRFWYDHETTRSSLVPCIRACRKTGIREIFFTLWGDNGAFCAYDSALAGLEFAASLAYGHEPEEIPLMSARFRAVCGEDFELFLELGKVWFEDKKTKTGVSTESLVWDDPLLGIGWLSYRSAGDGVPERYSAALSELCRKLETVEITETLRSVHALVRFLIARLRFQSAILDAWKAGKPGDVRQLVETEIPELVGLLDVFSSEIRAEWLRTARPFGLEIIQRRNAGVRERFFELLRRLRETDEVPELDAQLAALETGVRTPLRNTFSGTVIA